MLNLEDIRDDYDNPLIIKKISINIADKYNQINVLTFKNHEMEKKKCFTQRSIYKSNFMTCGKY